MYGPVRQRIHPKPQNKAEESMDFKEIATDRFFLGESALWCRERDSFFFVNIFEGELYEYFAKSGKLKKHTFGEIVSAVVLNHDGRLIVATQKGIGFYDTEKEKFTKMVHPNEKWEKVTRYNDCKCDPFGRLYAGTMDLNGQPGNGKLFRIEPDWSWKIALESVDYSNGMIWNQGKLFYTDTYKGEVYCFDYETNTGSLKNRQILCSFPPGWPDGMAMDVRGNLWIALWGGFGVACVDSVTGRILRKVKLPVPNVSSVCFGGKQGNEVLVTTARKDLSEEEGRKYSQSGAVYYGEFDVEGREFYRGRFL